MINTPKYPVSHEDRHLVCQEEVAGPLQIMLDLATTHGWGTIETITAIVVLKNLRLAYAEDPDPAEDPQACQTEILSHRMIGREKTHDHLCMDNQGAWPQGRSASHGRGGALGCAVLIFPAWHRPSDAGRKRF